ncbi:MAG: hypothetical protein ACI971_000923 [Colwellia sp.]|jgi:hypothetical protein
MKKMSIATFGCFYMMFIMNGFAVEHNSHVHGLAEMTIVIENDRLEIEIKSPAMNLVGFEHKASTQKHIAAVNKAELLLSNAKEIFSFTGGHCKLINKSLDLSHIKKNHHHLEKEDVKSINKHDNHSEAMAHYYYHCEKTSGLSAITVTLFDLFPSLQKVYVMWATENQQGAITLSATNKVINLRVNHE